MTDPITEADLHAFVDGQLDVARRMEIEDHLARHPEIAARVMADLRARDALGLAFGGRPARRSTLQVMDAARRLERGLIWRRIGVRLRRAAAVVLLVGAGWLAHAQVGLFEITDTEASPTPPAFVEDARHSHHTALIRARMVSQPEAADYDPAEILARDRHCLARAPARLAGHRRPGLSLALGPQRRARSRDRGDRTGVGLRGSFAVVWRDRADPGPFAEGHDRVLAVGRARLRAHRFRYRSARWRRRPPGSHANLR